MPTEVPESINVEKNKLDSTSAWLWLLAITITGVSEVLRFCNNTENLLYGGDIYNKCSFVLGPQESSTASKLPQRTLSITNTDLVNYLLPYVEDYNGIVGATVVVIPVNSEHLDVDMSSKAREFKITHSIPTEEQITFTLGAPNPMNQKFPLSYYYGLHCRYVERFKGLECGYDGSETVCSGTLTRCTELSNEERFGGCPGLRSKTVRFA